MTISLISAALALSPAMAQGGPGTGYLPYDADDYVIEWPTAAAFRPNDSFEHVEIGQFMGDGDHHAVVVRGGHLFTLYAPRVHSHVRTTSIQGVLDVGFLRGSDVSGPDRLLFTSATGLYLSDYQESTAGGVDTSSFSTPSLLLAGDWAGRRRFGCMTSTVMTISTCLPSVAPVRTFCSRGTSGTGPSPRLSRRRSALRFGTSAWESTTRTRATSKWRS